MATHPRTNKVEVPPPPVGLDLEPTKLTLPIAQVTIQINRNKKKVEIYFCGSAQGIQNVFKEHKMSSRAASLKTVTEARLWLRKF